VNCTPIPNRGIVEGLLDAVATYRENRAGGNKDDRALWRKKNYRPLSFTREFGSRVSEGVLSALCAAAVHGSISACRKYLILTPLIRPREAQKSPAEHMGRNQALQEHQHPRVAPPYCRPDDVAFGRSGGPGSVSCQVNQAPPVNVVGPGVC
jgi:hypothetical protein